MGQVAIFEEIMAENFTKTMEKIKLGISNPYNSQSQWKIKLILRYIILKLLTFKNKEKNLFYKARDRGKKHTVFKRETIRLIEEFLRETVEARRKGNYTFKLLKKNSVNLECYFQ